jgi:murein DD-endopeptidase
MGWRTNGSDRGRHRRCVAAVAAILAVSPCLVGTSAAERPAVVQSVDLHVPAPPRIVPIAGRPHLVYELHVTNFLPVDVALTRIQVRAVGPDLEIADYRGDQLGPMIGRPGLGRDHPRPHVVGRGLRAVAYFWIALGSGATPTALRHRVELEVMREAGPVPAQAEGGGTAVSSEDLVALGPPLRGGPWTAIYDPWLKSGHRTAFYTLGGRARIPGRFAIDWIRLAPDGTIGKPGTEPPPDWNGLGSEVLAVADATVADAADDIPDNGLAPWPGASRTENASGNYVALDLGRGRFAFYEHLQQGSLAVKRGDHVRRGQVIGRLGNSGSSSIGPHLHFHVGDTSALLASEGLPFVFTGFEDLGGFTSIQALIEGERWRPGPDGADQSRRGERPRANSVVRFP